MLRAVAYLRSCRAAPTQLQRRTGGAVVGGLEQVMNEEGKQFELSLLQKRFGFLFASEAPDTVTISADVLPDLWLGGPLCDWLVAVHFLSIHQRR